MKLTPSTFIICMFFSEHFLIQVLIGLFHKRDYNSAYFIKVLLMYEFHTANSYSKFTEYLF